MTCKILPPPPKNSLLWQAQSVDGAMFDDARNGPPKPHHSEIQSTGFECQQTQLSRYSVCGHTQPRGPDGDRKFCPLAALFLLVRAMQCIMDKAFFFSLNES